MLQNPSVLERHMTGTWAIKTYIFYLNEGMAYLEW
jgi:hypothetical protein